MALVDLKTDLKSLRYGKDNLGGGSSGQPFVKKPIPDSFSQIGVTGGSNFIVRGGTLVAESTVDDVSRLTQLLYNPLTPNGFLFSQKQKELGKTNVQTQASPTGYNAGKYNPQNTIKQAANSFKGEHYLKQDLKGLTYYNVVKNLSLEDNRLVGLTDTLVANKKVDTVNILTYPNGPGSSRGNSSTNIRLSDQRTGVNNINYSRYITPVQDPKTGGSYLQYSNGKQTQTEINYFNTVSKGSNSISNIVLGGDFQSITGFGRTLDTDNYLPVNALAKTSYSTLNNLQQTGNKDLGLNPSLGTQYTAKVQNDKNNKPFFFNPASDAYNNTSPGESITSNLTPSGDNIDAQSVYEDNLQSAKNNPKNLLTRKQIDNKKVYGDEAVASDPKDFRKDTDQSRAAYSSTSFNLNKKFKIGLPGYKNINRKRDPSSAKIAGQGTDRINYKKLGTQVTVMNDLIPFYIKIYENDSVNPTLIQFRAFIDSVSDSFSAQWESFKMMGRAEDFHTYKGFSRDFSMSFKIHAQSRPELLRLYEKVNRLVSTTAPDYSEGGFMRGVFVELTVGDWLRRTPGFVSAINLDIPSESPWEIGRNNNGIDTNEKNKLPHLINVGTFNFTPIHDFLPAYKKDFIRTT